MNLSSDLLSLGQLWLVNLVLWPVFYQVYKHLPWQVLLSDRALQHRFLGASVLLLLVWQIKVDISIGVAIHFLGITSLTLVFGWPLAMLSVVFAQLGLLYTSGDALSSFALNFLLNGAVPIGVTWCCHRFIESKEPRNPFVFIMGTGFAGCLIGCLAVCVMGVALLWLGGRFEFSQGATDYLAFLPLVLIPEAVINGMFISSLSILHPQWVTAFNDERYFQAPTPEDLARDKSSQKDLPPALDLDGSTMGQKPVNKAPSHLDEEPIEQGRDSQYRPPPAYYDAKDKDK